MRSANAISRAFILVLLAAQGCKTPGVIAKDNDVASGTAVSSAVPPSRADHSAPAGGAVAAASTDYPVDPSPPKDFHDDALLRTLARESVAVIICRLRGLQNIFVGTTDPDIFYAATCDVSEVLKGALPRDALRFIWQVERESRMPPPGSELLVHLKMRKERLQEDPDLKWVAIDTGVLRYTERLKADVHKTGLIRK